ncbi:MAG: 3-methyl-2-oxobutanoate hydroxymethyltransferase [Granulosicoccaceae bacterium]|jgi:3-methyl-2-oxobutanoate hydroxymethyltransferase
MSSASRIRPHDLRAFKQRGEKLAVLTAYDASFASLLDRCGLDIVLVGDSLGMVVQGRDTTRAVTVDDMVYHTANVARGIERACIIADMPYRSYDEPGLAVHNARRLVREGGADMVKLEGGAEQLPVIEAITSAGIPLCGHLGLLPQSVTEPGGFRVQGRSNEAAAQMLADARAMQAAGVETLVLECVPRSLGTRITQAVDIPVIGIGAGPDCDGQVLVSYDMLGITAGKRPGFVRNFLHGVPDLDAAIRAYVSAVKDGSYPSIDESYE